MTQAVKNLTFEEYLNLDAEDWLRLGLPEGPWEYREGELVPLPPESEPNESVADYLLIALFHPGIGSRHSSEPGVNRFVRDGDSWAIFLADFARISSEGSATSPETSRGASGATSGRFERASKEGLVDISDIFRDSFVVGRGKVD